jgi:hypothetical protein
MGTFVIESLMDITLSREELNLITWLIGAETLPGLEPDPTEGLTQQQQAMGIIYAERSLRERGLASLNDGHLAVNSILLTIVSICAHPDQSLFIFHTLQNGATYQHFGYQRGEAMVIHSITEGALHRLLLVPDQQAFIQRILSLCEADNLPEISAESITIDRDSLARARETVESGDTQGAQAFLREKGANSDPAKAVVSALAGPHTVSFIVQAREVDGASHKRELTILHSPNTSWVMEPTSNESMEQKYILSPGATSNVQKTLWTWLERE